MKNKKGFYKHAIEKALRRGEIALTYSDVILKTSHSDVMPNETNLETKFSRNVTLKIPFVSAAMDTVTEMRMAIALAQLGGIGIIHRNLSPYNQREQVAKVKNYLHGLIENPRCVYADEKIQEILERKRSEEHKFSTYPVLERSEGRLVGILTSKDFLFCQDHSKTAEEVMTKIENLKVAPPNTTPKEAYEIMMKIEKKALPLVDGNRKIAGLYVFSDVERSVNESGKDYNLDSKGRLKVGAAIGVYDDAFERLEELVKVNTDVVVIDTAHADSNAVFETLRKIKNQYNIDVVVGNISEPSSIPNLIKEGVDGIKIGQGPGSICNTRVIAGVGCPQITAIYTCAKKIEELGADIPLCADGGIRYSGDIAKAIAAGAHSVMIGRLFAETEESAGETITVEGEKRKIYRGMGSEGAMHSGKGSRERYKQQKRTKYIPEGVEGCVPIKGKLEEVVYQLRGGLEAAMGYTGTSSIEELRKKGDFYRITLAGLIEAHPHGIQIIKEAPNYRTFENEFKRNP